MSMRQISICRNDIIEKQVDDATVVNLQNYTHFTHYTDDVDHVENLCRSKHPKFHLKTSLSNLIPLMKTWIYLPCIYTDMNFFLEC